MWYLSAIFVCSVSWIVAHSTHEYEIVSTTNKPGGCNELCRLESKIDNNTQILQILIRKISQLEKSTNVSVTRLPRHCKDIQDRGNNISGVYSIQPEFAPKPFLVLCNMDTHGGGWTYFLNRFNGDQDFVQLWQAYKTGFGTLNNEFWLGLDQLHFLTGYEVNELLVEMEDWDSKKVYARYDAFSVGSNEERYFMRVLGNYSGTAGDSLSYHRGMKFTTSDSDNDLWTIGNCAVLSGGWWYNNCVVSHLTGKYIKEKSSADPYNVMFWNSLRGPNNIKVARMMVKPKIT